MPTVNMEVLEESRRHQVVQKYEVYPLNTSDVENYQIKLTNLSSNIKEDARIIQDSLLDQWVESKSNVWSKINNLKAKTPQIILGLSGNPSSKNIDDINETMVFGDDFTGVSALNRISYNTLWSGAGATDWLGRTYMVDNDGVWIVVYRQSDAHIGDGNSVYHIRFSDDEGVTWTNPDTLLNNNPVNGFPISGSDSKDAEGPSIMIAPNGDLIVQSCEHTIAGVLDATYQYRSTNDGATWSSEGKINNDPDFLGGHVSDSVNVGSTIYLAITSSKYNNFDSACLYKSTNNGTNWTFVSDITSSNTCEPGIEYVGNNTFLVLLRTVDKSKTYQRISTDLGLTWGALTDVTSQLGIFQRAQLQIFSDEPDRVYAVGRDDLASEYSVVYYTDDNGSSWHTKFYPDPTGYVDAAYCYMLKRDNGTFYMLSYGGTASTAVIKEYIFDKSGIEIDSSKWDTSDTPTITSGKVVLTNDDIILSITKYGYGYAFESYAIANEQDSGFLAVRETISNENNILYIINTDSVYPDDFDMFRLYTTEAGVPTTNWLDNWNDFRTQYRKYSIYRPAADDVTFVQDEHSYHQTTGNIPIVNLGLGFYVWDSSQESTLDVDWCFVRKYITNEPIIQNISKLNRALLIKMLGSRL